MVLGLFYPDLGILVFNGLLALNAFSFSFNNFSSNVAGGNVVEFYEDIRVASCWSKLRREEVITSQHYFCRVPNKEFNFSSNPTFTSGSNGDFTVGTFLRIQKSFITQVRIVQ